MNLKKLINYWHSKDLNNIEFLKSEFKAVRNLLDEVFDNLEVKIPFIRDSSEYVSATEIMKRVGIKPHRDLEVGNFI